MGLQFFRFKLDNIVIDKLIKLSDLLVKLYSINLFEIVIEIFFFYFFSYFILDNYYIFINNNIQFNNYLILVLI